jgi:hypothetical protein
MTPDFLGNPLGDTPPPFPFPMQNRPAEILPPPPPALAPNAPPSPVPVAPAAPVAAKVPKGPVIPKEPKPKSADDQLTDKLTAAANSQVDSAMSDIDKQRDRLASEQPRIDSAAEDYRAFLENNSPHKPESLAQRAPVYADFAQQVSPFAILLTALGGKIGKLSGSNILGAVTGLVEGTNEGNWTKYQSAYRAYKDNYDAARQEHADMNAYYNQMMEHQKDVLGAEQSVAQTALSIIGADQKSIENALNTKKALDKTQVELEKQWIKLQQIHAQSGAGNDASSALSPDALDNAVTDVLANPERMKNYASFGKAGQAIRMQISNAIAERLKSIGMTQQEVIQQQSVANAQVKSVKDLVGMQNAVQAYETVARGNGERALQLIRKVNSTGVPIFNSGKRIIEQQSGNPDAAELMQVMQNYQTEVARIIANPRLVGQLSDSARKEIMASLPANMTPEQAERVINRLNFEFELRNKGISNQIEAAQMQMTPGSSPQAPVAPAAAVSAPAADPLEGKTATNPTTHQTLIRRNGAWVPSGG